MTKAVGFCPVKTGDAQLETMYVMACLCLAM